MAVTAHDSGAGKGEALLGTNDVDDALTLIAQAEICDSEVLNITLESKALEPGVFLLDEGLDVLEVFPRGGGDVLTIVRATKMMASSIETYVIGGRKCAIRPSHLPACILEALESLLLCLLAIVGGGGGV
jgi:hypothetical protein